MNNQGYRDYKNICESCEALQADNARLREEIDMVRKQWKLDDDELLRLREALEWIKDSPDCFGCDCCSQKNEIARAALESGGHQ